MRYTSSGLRLPAASVALSVALLGACSSKDTPSGPPKDNSSSGTSVTVTLSAAGGTVRLADGTAVVFPPGAAPAGTRVTLAKGDPATFVDGPGEAQRVLLQISAGVAEFTHEVEIRVPLPAPMTPADSTAVVAGVVEDSTGTIQVRPSTVQVVEGRPFLVVRTRHFSNWLLEWMSGKTPPRSAGPLMVPYYSQGASNYCWATSLQMVTRAVRHNSNHTIPEIVGVMKVDEGGITGMTFRTSSALANLVKNRTGVRPTRKVWPYGTWTQLRDDLKREIGVHGRPVALFATHWNHAVVVVGYDGNTFHLHDPASTRPGGSLGYEPRTWDAILTNTGILDNFVTLVVPAPLDTGVLPLRINFLRQAFSFVRPSEGPGDPSTTYEYRWDPTRSRGYSFVPSTGDGGVDPLPGGVQTLRTPGELEVTNSHPTERYQGMVRLTLSPIGAPSGYGFTLTQPLDIGPNAKVGVRFPDIPVDTFRFNQATPTEYLLNAYVSVNHSLVDEQDLFFRLAPVTPEITSVEPSTAGVGEEVLIRGKGFGTSRYRNRVTVGTTEATEIPSWSDRLIRIKVPSGAQSGDVVVVRGEVPSNKVPLTIRAYETSRSFDLEWGEPGATNRLSARVRVALEVEAVQGGWLSVREERSAFDPMSWVKLWFRSLPLSAGQSHRYRLTIRSVQAETNYGSRSLTWVNTFWLVRNQETGMVESTLEGPSVEVTELYSWGRREVDVKLQLRYTPAQGEPVFYERDGLTLSFHPTNR